MESHPSAKLVANRIGSDVLRYQRKQRATITVYWDLQNAQSLERLRRGLVPGLKRVRFPQCLLTEINVIRVVKISWRLFIVRPSSLKGKSTEYGSQCTGEKTRNPAEYDPRDN